MAECLAVGWASTMDTTLPIITKFCGKDLVFVALFHKILVELTVQLFVSITHGNL